MKRLLKKWLIHYLSKELTHYVAPQKSEFQKLIKVILPGDALLVEGKQRFSKAIKYLTQSNWSHVALYVGDGRLIEADLEFGVRELSLEEYSEFHTRICRPKNLTQEDLNKLINFTRSKIGGKYDIQLVTDLLKIVINPKSKMRNVLQHLGSSDPTEVICSSLIADAFHSINYPILPIAQEQGGYHKINPTLVTPSDFDISPYFYIVKPTLYRFEYKKFFKSDSLK